MKRSTVIRVLIPLLLLVASCKKEKNCDDKDPVPPVKGNLIRIQQGTGLPSDTVKLINYDALDRIYTVVDSVYKDTMYAYYDASGRLSAILQVRHIVGFNGVYVSKDSARFAYNSSGLLIQADYSNAGQKNRLVFEYNNGIVSRYNYYSDFGAGGPLSYFRYYRYDVIGGNITAIKQYNLSNNLVDEIRLTYGTQLNPFKNISLFNFANKLGTSEVINYERYFCNNILTGYTDNSSSVSIENSFNTLQKPVKTVSNYDIFFGGKDYDKTFTRYFTYN